MKFSITKKFLSLAVVLLFVAGCEDFLNINEDPNNPTDVPVSQLLPTAQLAVTYAVDNSSGGLSGHATTVMHQYAQRGNMSDYQPLSTDFAIIVPWANYFTNALPDLETIITKGTTDENWHYVGIAQILKAYSYSVMVDLWGDVPYFEATQGAENPYPEFDGGQAIYSDLFLLIDEGIANLAKTSNLVPRADDLFYNGNVTKWRKFAKTLKLKLYTQIRLVQDVSSEVQALVTEGDLIGPDDDFEMNFGTSFSPENRNPGFVQEWSEGGQFYYISPYFFEIMRSEDTFNHGGIQFGEVDPRIPYYFFNQLPDGSTDGDAQNPCSYCPSRSGTGFLSIWAFSFNIDPNEGFDQSQSQAVAGLYPIGGRFDNGNGGIASNASSLPAGRVTGPGIVAQRILTYFQRKYIEAELAWAGLTNGDPRALLVEAIDASFAKVNDVAAQGSAPVIADADRDTYRDAVIAVYDAAGAGTSGELEVIMTQKWIASFGYGIDIYNDYRRTGFPRLHDGNTDNLNVTARTREFPVSFPYEQVDLITNPSAPPQRNIALDKVFWDAN